MIALMIHGGAWDIPDDLVEAHRQGVARALAIGWEILSKGGSSIDAVEKSINAMEDDPTFDAGRGSFVNSIGEIELDASIMNGSTFRAGAIAAVQNIRYPISLARSIMENSEHILLVGTGAVRFGREHGILQCRDDDLLVGRELERWKELQGKENVSTKDAFRKKRPGDTVGAVALDENGLIVAGTSTGGTPNKYPGRVGDSPLIGCGTYADSTIGGVSCTGWGEAIIKVVLAKTVVDMMEHNGGDPVAAATQAIERLEEKVEGYGGVIVLNREGVPAVFFNTPRMARAYCTSAMASARIEV
ncbi:MAG: isoaspartyl peptidase/L-asparaginase [Ignavibacteriales bacterium]|nr:isoaspartyl peptidase/L-asparaginase [Ignavibacteriales bacterium]